MLCPEPFYSNCRNALKRCQGCKAGPQRRQTLHYDPIEDLGEHPATGHRNEYSRAGRKAERKTLERINKALKPTVASGARHDDGDFEILDSFRGEHKLRLTKQSISLTWQEYIKGRRQGVDHWFITIQKESKSHSFVILTEDAYIALLKLIQSKSQD